MSDSSHNQPGGSAGKVETKVATIQLPTGGLRLERGGILPELQVAYETYGRLSPNKDNAIFICHALSGDAHVAGYHDSPESTPGWWDEMVGPGKGVDTDHYFVVCANILGGCMGTTGPSSPNPATGRPYGSDFPLITVGDIVDVHVLLLRHLGLERLAAVMGGSFGGMQVMEWAVRYPDMLDSCVCIASATSLSAQALAFDIVGRKAIMSDPDWQGGNYHTTGRAPTRGLASARKIGHITYLSQEMMEKKFGREKNLKTHPVSGDKTEADFMLNFQIESYLEHQGEKFVGRFDANSYLHITRAMDEYDLVTQSSSIEKAFEKVNAKFLIIALSADWLFPPEQSIEIANALLRAGKRVSYCNLNAPHGHDAFLVDIKHLSEVVRAFLPWVREDGSTGAYADCAGLLARLDSARREEFEIIRTLIRPGTRVLDLGCGSGDLLTLLACEKKISGIGVDIDIEHVIDVIDKGHDVFQADIDGGLAMIPDATYDYAILNQTLQVVRKPRFALREMLRVARKGIVSFPNFGKWTHRLQIGFRGRMPKGGSLPFEWYDTPNIHLFTLKDFIEVCREDGIQILRLTCLPACWVSRLLLAMGLRNLGADRILAKVTSSGDGQRVPEGGKNGKE